MCFSIFNYVNSGHELTLPYSQMFDMDSCVFIDEQNLVCIMNEMLSFRFITQTVYIFNLNFADGTFTLTSQWRERSGAGYCRLVSENQFHRRENGQWTILSFDENLELRKLASFDSFMYLYDYAFFFDDRLFLLSSIGDCESLDALKTVDCILSKQSEPIDTQMHQKCDIELSPALCNIEAQLKGVALNGKVC